MYKIINVRKIRYDWLILFFLALLATYPNTIELIIVAITTSIMLKWPCIVYISLYTIVHLLRFL